MKKMKLLLIIGGILITGITALVQYFEEEKNKKEEKQKENALNSKIDTLNLDNSKLSNQLSDLLVENSKLSHQLTETSIKLSETAIGSGDLDVGIKLYSEKEFRFSFTNNSNSPVYDAYITIENLDEIHKCGILNETDKDVFLKSECREKCNFQEAPLTINSKATIIVSKLYYLTESLNFSIYVNSRKKFALTQYAFILDNGEYKLCSRHFNIIKNKPVLVNTEMNFNLPNDYWDKHFFGTRSIMYMKK